MNGAWEVDDRVGERASVEAARQEGGGPDSLNEVPADVAALYRWLDVQDLGYREFAAVGRPGPPGVTRLVAGPVEEIEDALKDGAAAATEHDGRNEVPQQASETDAEQAIRTTSMLPERLPARQESRLRWRVFEGHPGKAGAGPSLASKPAGAGVTGPETGIVAATGAAAIRGEAVLPTFEEEKGNAARGVAHGKPDAEAKMTESRDASSGETPVGEQVPPVAASDTPAWIEAYARRFRAIQRKEPSGESLKRTRERLAARWYGLRGLLKINAPESSSAYDAEKEAMPPMLVLFSLAGGTGKTSLAASLTRVLAAQGERVLLISVTEAETLPFHFGAGESRNGDRRVFAPPAGVADAPVHVLHYKNGDLDLGLADQRLAARVRRDGKGFSRIVVDLGSSESKDVQALLTLGGCVLVPLVPDMNSLLGLGALRQRLAASAGEGGQPGHVWYVLSRFHAAEPLHLDIREVLEQELAERLLPLAIRASAAVPEALAQGMTVVDYAPADGAAQDVQQLAAWVRTLQEPAREGLAQVRWSERP